MACRVPILGSVLLLFHSVDAVSQPRRPTRPLPPREVLQPAVISVVIFERKDFGGRSMPLAIGEHRLADWKPASIKVPAGLLAYLYQSADSAGGYGVAVDLLEDHGDLAEFGLAGNVSLVNVLDASRGGQYFWARARRGAANEFVPGHWERKRASGNPVNLVAVASPPLPSRAPAAPTAIARHGTRWVITTLGPQSSADDARWTGANATMGVIGSDFRGLQEIGSAAVERDPNNPVVPPWINFWYPNKQKNDHRSVVYFKRTLVGVITDKVTKNWSGGRVPDGQGGWRVISSGSYELSDVPHVSNIKGTYEDFDLNIDVTPNADYMYLIRDSHAPERSREKFMKDLVDSDHDPCTDPFFKVEGEVDATDSAKHIIADALHARIGKQVAMYGPWIYDIGHCSHPEIHPTEQIWWTENAPNNGQIYHLNVFADASGRFLWRSQMDDGTKLRPWAAPPITGVFAIAFETKHDPSRADPGGGKRFDVANVDFRNVVATPGTDTTYDLVYGNRTLVSFAPHNDSFTASYENVGFKPGTTDTVRGFLVISTTVGSVQQTATSGVIPSASTSVVRIEVSMGADPDKIDARIEKQVFQKLPGHYLFTVTRTDLGGLVVR